MSSTKDELADVLAETLNSKFKENTMAYFLDGPIENPANIKGWISTGSSILDLAISNKPHGGIAIGRITEITGLESTGKSLIGAHILAETQKKGGLAVYIDTETSVNRQFLEAIGVNISTMLYLHPDTIEDIFTVITQIIAQVRESDKERVVTILVDSLAGTTTRKELEGDFDKEGWNTDKAIITSKALRKITQMIGRQQIALVFTNQLRVNLGVTFGDPYTTSGGKALGFHASTRIRLKRLGMIKDTKDKNLVLGMKIRAQVIKNRLGPPMRHADFNLFFDKGIDDYSSWLEVLKSYELVKQGGAWYSMENHEGEIIKFQSKDFAAKLTENEDFKNYIYDIICEKHILKYKYKDRGIDDIKVDLEPDND